MKTNADGKFLIAMLETEYEPEESLTAAEKAVNLLVRADLNTNQFSALVCLVMFIGIDEFRASPMLKLINASFTDKGRILTAANEFGTYVYDGDEVDPFLVEQRALEKSLFLQPMLVRKP